MFLCVLSARLFVFERAVLFLFERAFIFVVERAFICCVNARLFVLGALYFCFWTRVCLLLTHVEFCC